MVRFRFAVMGGLVVAGWLVGSRAEAGFSLGWSLPLSGETHGVALADMDLDGDLDAYVAGFEAPDVLWLNQGNGTFTASSQVLPNSLGSYALLGPLDPGPSPDLFWIGHLVPNQVWFNDGLGSLSNSGQVLGGSWSRSQGALGDLDGDGDLDACLPANDPSDPARVFVNNGSGVFSDSGQLLSSAFTQAVALGDLDGDSDLDVVLGINGANKVWKNNGSAVFTDTLQAVGNQTTFGVALGDLDGDGDLDAFTANGSLSGEPEEVFFNDGTGVFTLGQQIGSDPSLSVVLLDCDGDGDRDAFVGNNAGVLNRLYRNHGAGVFTAINLNVGLHGATSVAAGDVDGDGDTDLFLGNHKQPEQVLLNNGSCVFLPSSQFLGGNWGNGAALGDLDGDGDEDAAVGSDDGIVRVLRNDGRGSFELTQLSLAHGLGLRNTALALADFDGDGDLDLYAGNGEVSPLGDDPSDRVWRNNGSGFLTDSGQLLGNDYLADLAVGDVDGDGDLDVVAANTEIFTGVGTHVIYLNDGAGTFSASAQGLGSSHATAVALGDLDGDGDLDIVLANRVGGSSVWRNDGSGGFASTGQVLGNATTESLELGDLDGDGDLDVYLGNDRADTVWMNDGTGLLTDSLQQMGFLNTLAVHLFDVDEGGDLDAWTTNGGRAIEALEVFLNTGTGSFTSSGWNLASLAGRTSVLGRLDSDFDPDVFVVGTRGDHQVWLNDVTSQFFEDGFESGDTSGWTTVVP